MTIALTAFAAFLCAYAALAGLSWLRRLIREIPNRRRAMVLNLARRSVPQVIAGVVVLIGTSFATILHGVQIAAILIGGGLAFGLHLGLAELRQGNWRVVALRVAVASAITLLILWQTGAS